MAITVKIIQEKEFKHKMRGYDDVEVDDFLDEIAEEFDRLTRENAELRKKATTAAAAPTAAATGEDSSYVKSLENTLRDTLVMAQRTSDETIREAQTKASGIVANAEREAERIVGDAQDQVIALREEFNVLKQRASSFVDSQHKVLTDIVTYFEGKSEELGYSAEDDEYAAYGADTIGEIGEPEEAHAPVNGFGEPQSEGDMGDTMVFKNLRV